MPWCETCARWWAPNTLERDGSCPSCGRVVAEAVEPRAPWHFKLLVASAAAYLGWRAIQGVAWVLSQVT